MKEKLREMREKMKKKMVKEKKITITLEGYSTAVDAVIKKMTLPTTSAISKSIMIGIVSKAAWDLWDQLMRMSEVEKFVDDLGKVVDQMIEEEEEEKRR